MSPIVIELEQDAVATELHAGAVGHVLTLEEKKETIRQLFMRLIMVASQLPNAAFRNFYGRFRYLLNTKLPPEEWQAFDAFRRYLKSDVKVTDKDIWQGFAAVEALAKKLDLFAKAHPGIGADFDAGYFQRRMPTRDFSQLKSCRYLVTRIPGIKKDQRGNEFFMVQGCIIDHLAAEIPLILGQKFLQDGKLLSVGDQIFVSNVRFKDGKRGNYLMTSFDSLLVLAPDFLLDASSLGDCFQMRGASFESFFLNKLESSVPGAAALNGTIVGQLLDAMLRGNVQFEVEFDAILQELKLWAAKVGSQSVRQIRSSIRTEHLDNLRILVETEKQKDVWIEPTYFSSTYGLQGRLDVLGLTPTHKDIVELKSGKPSNPAYNLAWINHQMQVVSYDLLLASTYPVNQVGSKSIFYSRAQVAPYRVITSEHAEKLELLRVRNQIVRAIFQIAENNFSVFRKMWKRGIVHLPAYNQAFLEAYRDRFDQASPLAVFRQAFFFEMVAFTMRELVNAKVGSQPALDKGELDNGLASLWQDALDAKRAGFTALPGLKLIDIDDGKGHLYYAIPEDAPHRFRKGDLVICCPIDADGYRPLRQHILKGSLHSISRGKVTVSLFNKQTDYAWIKARRGEWCLEPDIFERNYWSTIGCLYHVLDPQNANLDMLRGTKPIRKKQVHFHSDELTRNQNQVIADALSAQNYYLLQGPPGTGKTSTFLVNYVKSVIDRSEDNICIIAYTNKAVDNICNSLRNNRYGHAFEFIRIGSKHVNDPNLVSDRLSGNDPDGWANQLKRYRIVVLTLASLQNNLAMVSAFWRFDQLIVDEASQVTEADLGGIVVNFRKSILIGDHKQLPPVITQSEEGCKVKSAYLTEFGIINHRKSMFERLFEKGEANNWTFGSGQLTEQYRMNIQILNLIQANYAREIICGRKELLEVTLPLYQIDTSGNLPSLGKFRTVFIDTTGSGNGKQNQVEADICEVISRQLIENTGLRPGDIGIIAPFRAQVNLIRKQLDANWLNAENPLVVDTVERFQGDEKSVIIFSTTVTSIGMLSRMQSISQSQGTRTDRKLLVSISRARDQFICLGSRNTLMRSADYADVLKKVMLDGKSFEGIQFVRPFGQ